MKAINTINAIKDFSHFWQRVFQTSISLLFLMSIIRLILFLLAFHLFTARSDHHEIITAFIVGVRFDFLVISFLLIPILPISYFFLLKSCNGFWRSFLGLFFKIYFILCWALIWTISLIDGPYFLSHHERLRYGSYASLFKIHWLNEITQAFSKNYLLSYLILFIGILGFKKILKNKFNKTPKLSQSLSLVQKIIRLTLPLFILALGARGTWTPHHLNIEHSQISSFKFLNELSLNAAWSFDK